MTNQLEYYYSNEYMFKCINFSSINSSSSSRNFTKTTFSNSNFNDSLTANDNDDADDDNMSAWVDREESNRRNRKCLSNFVYDKTYYKSTITEQVSYIDRDLLYITFTNSQFK